MRHVALALLLPLSAFFWISNANATVALHDDFDDGMLDDAWFVELIDATGWIYEESGTELTVTDITDPQANSNWARARLTRGIPPLEDFSLDFDFSWDCQNNGDAMQCFFVRMKDDADILIAASGYWDAWQGISGCRYAQVGSSSLGAAPGSLTLAGSAAVNITRTSGHITMTWNGGPLFSGDQDLIVDVIEIEFMYFLQSGGSLFGEESIDLIHIEDLSASDVPGTGPARWVEYLGQAVPNPFNPQTTIAFELPERQVVTLRLFDISGRLVKNLVFAESQTPGRHEVVWNGRDDAGRPVASGTYFYCLDAGTFSDTKRMVLVK